MKPLILTRLKFLVKISKNLRNVTSVLEFSTEISVSHEMVSGNIFKLYQNPKSGFMDRSIFTAMMIDLSEYLNVKYPGEQFAVMMDNDSFHSLLKVLPHENMVFIMIPSDCTVKGMNYSSVWTDSRHISLRIAYP